MFVGCGCGVRGDDRGGDTQKSNCSGMGDSSSGSPEGLRCSPLLCGRNSSFERHSQGMEERATLDRYHHFHGNSGMCA